MGIVTWEDVTPLPSKVEIDSEKNTMTVTLDLPLNADTLLANLPRPPVKHSEQQKSEAAVPM